MQSSPGQRMIVALSLVAFATWIGFHPTQQAILVGSILFGLAGITAFVRRMRTPSNGPLPRRVSIMVYMFLFGLATFELALLNRGHSLIGIVPPLAMATGMFGFVFGRDRSSQ